MGNVKSAGNSLRINYDSISPDNIDRSHPRTKCRICTDLGEKYKATNWKTLPIAEIRKLRQLKNLLQVIAALANTDKYVLDEKLKTWLSVRERLP